ncbi:hypothetical protein VTP01DRAFT_5192 [Rhizomucor pusillus]|uniref:uncharacterized protein n=1 Tax=Rhizomucor pusillus TaxID=4840 RepID=UPI0037445A7F
MHLGSGIAVRQDRRKLRQTITSDATYEPDEHSSSESACTVTVTRKYMFDYLVGPGIEHYEEPDNATKWIVDDMDITAAFHRYRQNVLTAAKRFKILSVAEQLALNFVFLLSNSPEIGLNFEGEILEVAMKQIRYEYVMKSMAESDVLWCYKLNQATRCSQEEGKLVLIEWEKDTNETPSSRLYRDIYRELLKAYSDKYNTLKVNEDTFLKDTLVTILRSYFENSRLIYTEGANGVLMGSRRRRQGFDPESEVRCCYCWNANLHEAAQHLLKLGNAMKDCMNEAIRAGADDLDIEVCGIVCAGHRCDVYVMDLRYQGMYRLKRLSTFFLPVDHTNFDVLLGVFQVMDLVQQNGKGEDDGSIFRYPNSVACGSEDALEEERLRTGRKFGRSPFMSR